MAFFALALLFTAAAESTTTTALPTAEEKTDQSFIDRLLQDMMNEQNATLAPTQAPADAEPEATASPTPNATAAPTPPPPPPVEVSVSYTLDEASFTAMTAMNKSDVFDSFAAAFANATGVPGEDVTVINMTVGGEAVEFAGRRLSETSVEVDYEIEVQDEAALNATNVVVADIETLKTDLASALVAEVADSLNIKDMTAVAAPGGFEPQTPKPTPAASEETTPEPEVSGAYMAVFAIGLLY